MAHANVSPVKLVSNGHDELVSELVSLFEAEFAAKTWVERYRLLEQIFSHLEENLRDRELVVPAFAGIVEQLVLRVGSPAVTCGKQAHIYAASKALAHQRQAQAWFAWSSRGGGDRHPSRHSLQAAHPA